ncbi:MAG: hypothetical protein FWE74_02745 [Oscillospiraceae bacterium]|nr:hypothetical protein [Oscillospiraceae bacterium]
MRKFIKRIKSNAGVSLTELVIGMALLSIFVITVGGLLTNVTRLQNRVIDLTELNSLVDNISNKIIRDLTNAVIPLELCNFAVCKCDENCDPNNPNPDERCSDGDCDFNCAGGKNRFALVLSSEGSVVYSVDNSVENRGALFRSCNTDSCPIAGCLGHPVLHKDFYKFKSVNFVLEPAATGTGTAYVLTISITEDSDGRILTSREYAIRPIALNQYGV